MSAVADPVGSLQVAFDHARGLLTKEPALALEQAAEILKVAPRHPETMLLAAAAQRLLGSHADAAATLRRLLASRPDWAPALLAYGAVLDVLGQHDQAHAALRRAVATEPALPTVWLALAQHLQARGNAEGADAAYTRHVLYAPRDPQLMTAAAALAENRVPDAEHLLRNRLRDAPNDVAALRMLAEVAARLGRSDDAEQLLGHCLDLAPGFDAARQNYALVLHRANKPEAALAQVERLLAKEPTNASARNLKAAILCRVGDYLPAIAIYDALLAEYPKQAKLWLSCGHALKTAGLRDRAIAAYRRCVEIDPGFGEAYWSLANLKTLRFDDADLAVMQRQARRNDLDAEQRAQFEFALGKAFEDRAEYAASFGHYATGNAQRRAQLPYDADDASARVRRSKAVFTRDCFDRLAGSGNASPDPIFVVGLPRSGSTLIEQILSSHSQVEGTMELPEIIGMTKDLRQRAGDAQLGSYHELVATLSRDELAALGAEYLERTRIQRKTAAPYFIDKMPNNFFHAGLIHLMLPNARIVDARRHPLACCFSGFKQYFARGQNFSYGLDDIGRYYRDYVELMAHYDEVLPGRIHRVVYERMIDDTEGEVRRLLDYCGLPFEEGCLRFFENERPVRTASSEQVRQPIYREGVDHWRHYESWLEPLKQVLGPVLDRYPEVPAFAPGVDGGHAQH